MSKIEWTDETWNPATGCSKVSPGCLNCYGERLSRRSYQGDHWKPWTKKNIGTNLRIHVKRMLEPFRWYEPRKVFVCSMGDLFHEDLPVSFISDVFGVMGAAWWHTFQVLTKRPEIALEVLDRGPLSGRVHKWNIQLRDGAFRARKRAKLPPRFEVPWPLPNVWVGTSIEGQREAVQRIPELLKVPAAKRFVSAEPLLDPINLKSYLWPTCWHWDSKFQTSEEALAAGAFAELKPQSLVSANRKFIDWVIVGGESGPGARPIELAWVKDIIRQCRAAGVKVFIKQLGTAWAKDARARSYKGSDPAEWPKYLQIREFPDAS